MAEEFDNQESWRAAPDKLTFILCRPAAAEDGEGPARPVDAGTLDTCDRMIGDVNLFLHPWDDDDHHHRGGGDRQHGRAGQDGGGGEGTPTTFCSGEVDIMIAAPENRGHGLGKAAVSAFLHYIWSSREAVLREYRASMAGRVAGTPLEFKRFVAKIKATNAHSIALFKALGFAQEGGVNYFGEVNMVLADLEHLGAPPEGYTAAQYRRPAD